MRLWREGTQALYFLGDRFTLNIGGAVADVDSCNSDVRDAIYASVVSWLAARAYRTATFNGQTSETGVYATVAERVGLAGALASRLVHVRGGSTKEQVAARMLAVTSELPEVLGAFITNPLVSREAAADVYAGAAAALTRAIGLDLETLTPVVLDAASAAARASAFFIQRKILGDPSCDLCLAEGEADLQEADTRLAFLPEWSGVTKDGSPDQNWTCFVSLTKIPPTVALSRFITGAPMGVFVAGLEVLHPSGLVRVASAGYN